MVLYYSATGNSRYVAECIASATGDVAKSIIALQHAGEHILHLSDSEALVLVFPTYHYGLPMLLRTWLASASIFVTGRPVAYAVATYGTTSGAACRFAADIIKSKHLFNSVHTASVHMPDTWTPTFDLSNPIRNAEVNARADEDIARLAALIARRRPTSCGERMPRALAWMASHWVYHFSRRTQHLHATSACIGCGLCAKLCTAQVIEMRGRRPHWIASRCDMCLACLHHCPRFAIQYGARTQRHGQYIHPPYSTQ